MQQELNELYSLSRRSELATNPLELLHALSKIQMRILAKMVAEDNLKVLKSGSENRDLPNKDIQGKDMQSVELVNKSSVHIKPPIDFQPRSTIKMPFSSPTVPTVALNHNTQTSPHPYQTIQSESLLKASNNKLEQKDINEYLKDSVQESLSENLSRIMVKDLMDVMSLNEQFLFVNTLFKQDLQAFQSFIDVLNKTVNIEQAEAVLQNAHNYYAWGELEADAFASLNHLVSRRFLKK